MKKYGVSGVAIGSVQKNSVGDDVIGTLMEEIRIIAARTNSTAPPLVIDAVVVDGRVTEIRQTSDYERAIAGLKRGAKVALGLSVPARSDRDYKYEHRYVPLSMP